MRPRTIPVVAGALFAATVIAVVVGVSLLFPNPLLNRLWELNKPGAAVFRSLGWIAGVSLLALGAATALTGRGLLRGRRWAWWFAVVLFAVNGSGDVVGFALTHDWLHSASGVVVAAAFVFALTRPSVRRYFTKAA